MNSLDSLHSRSPAGPELKVLLGRLSSEITDRLKKGSPESVDFFVGSVRSLAKVKGTAHASVRMGSLFDCATFLFENGHAAAALEATGELERLARQAGAKEGLRKAASMFLIVYADLGNVADAVISSTTALAIAREISDVQGEMSTLINLGGALNYGGLFREAIPCFQRVVLLSRTFASVYPSDTVLCEAAALTNQAQSYMYLEEFSEGFRAISRALEISPEPRDAIQASSRTIREFTCVQLALRLGNLPVAMQHGQSCERYGLMAGTVRSRLIANISRGLCEVHSGAVDKGLALLEAQLAEGGDHGSFRAEALSALVHSYEAAGRPDRALKCLGMLLSRVRSARERGLDALLSLPNADPAAVSTEFEDLREFTGRESRLRAKVAELELASTRFEMFERLATAADLKEEASGEHGYRVGKLAFLMAEALEWPREACQAIEAGARLHDIGKVALPDHLLLSTSTLKEAERQFVSMHTSIGAELLSKGSVPQLRMAAEIAHHHHEWWDGSGYPSKLAGKRIPIHARIVALADVFDALTHGRPYAEPWPIDRALAEITQRRGTQFDPELTDILVSLIARLQSEHPDLDAYLGKAGRDSPFLQAREKIRQMLAEGRENERKAALPEAESVH